MKRILSNVGILSFIVITQILTVLIFTGRPSNADPGPACVAGDVNGDFVLDVSDPIYLLQNLFLSGPAPVACASNSAQVVSLGVSNSTGCLAFGEPVIWDTEYVDPCDLHEDGSPIVTLPPGTWLIHLCLDVSGSCFGPADFAVFLDGEPVVNPRAAASVWTTLVSVAQPTELTLVYFDDTPGDEGRILGDLFLRASESIVVRVGDN